MFIQGLDKGFLKFSLVIKRQGIKNLRPCLTGRLGHGIPVLVIRFKTIRHNRLSDGATAFAAHRS